jgi:hypothetical protein
MAVALNSTTVALATAIAFSQIFRFGEQRSQKVAKDDQAQFVRKPS